MTILRTPDERFRELPGFDYEPRYVDVEGLRLHYVDEGDGETVVCLHGEPTWSFLYRKVLESLKPAYRVVLPDLLGFGRSDKLSDVAAYSFDLHLRVLGGFFEALSLRDVTLVVHDWGGLLGLSLAAEEPERFARLVILNTFLPTGEEPVTEAFLQWRHFVEKNPDLPVGRVIRMGCAHGDRLSPKVVAAYEAPFPDASYKGAAASFPLLVPLQPEDPGAAEMRRARRALAEWRKPTLVLFSDKDPILRGADDFFRRLIPAAREGREVIIQDAGHYLQEEKGEEVGEKILDFLGQ